MVNFETDFSNKLKHINPFMQYKALIIEDEPAASRRLEKMILEADPSFEIIGKLDSVSSSIRWLKDHPQPDLVFLDINLGDGLSFGIFDEIDVRCPIIFTTAYDEYAIKAFKVNSIDYLLKPIKQDELNFSIQKFKSHQADHQDSVLDKIRMMLESMKSTEEKWKKRFVVNFGDKIKAVETTEIAYFMILEKSVFLVTHQNDSYGINYSLDQLDGMLDPARFYRVNRKYIVAFSCIENMWSYSRSRVKLQIRPTPPEDVIVSTERSAGFKEWLNQ